MKRVFIQTICKFPHGGALSNYILVITKAIIDCGYDVILATDINNEYDYTVLESSCERLKVIPIMPSSDETTYLRQKESGYCVDRMAVFDKHKICKEDVVIQIGLRSKKSELFLGCLLKLRDKVGFKVIFGLFELYGLEDNNKYCLNGKYNEFIHAVNEFYPRADAILTVSEFIDKYFINKGVKKVYRFPPMIDSFIYTDRSKIFDKYRFIIPSGKDSLNSMLLAFCGLEEIELENIELHICGVDSQHIEDIRNEIDFKKIESHVVVHEWLKYDKLAELYQKMHFLVIARNECQRTLANFPSKVPEVMACGVVPIVSEVGDYTKYYLRNGYDSIFIKGDSVEEVRMSIRNALAFSREKYLYYSDNAKKTADEIFDYHVWIPKIMEMLED